MKIVETPYTVLDEKPGILYQVVATCPVCGVDYYGFAYPSKGDAIENFGERGFFFHALKCWDEKIRPTLREVELS